MTLFLRLSMGENLKKGRKTADIIKTYLALGFDSFFWRSTFKQGVHHAFVIAHSNVTTDSNLELI